jgi:hypothetical protein
LRAGVDDLVVDVNLAHLDGAVEEFGEQQVLAFGCELRDTVRRGRRSPLSRRSRSM